MHAMNVVKKPLAAAAFLFGVNTSLLISGLSAAELPVTAFSTGGHTVYHLRPATVERGGGRVIISSAFDSAVLCHTPDGKLRWKAETSDFRSQKTRRNLSMLSVN